MIGRNGERRSGISAQAARHDDDDDDIYIKALPNTTDKHFFHLLILVACFLLHSHESNLFLLLL